MKARCDKHPPHVWVGVLVRKRLFCILCEPFTVDDLISTRFLFSLIVVCLQLQLRDNENGVEDIFTIFEDEKWERNASKFLGFK